MALVISEELLPVLVPVILYWVGAYAYHLLLSSDEDRLYSQQEEEKLNPVSKRQVIIGVLVNQGLQMAFIGVLFMISDKKKAPVVNTQSTSLLQLLKQLSIGLLIMDGWEYLWHRIMHESEFLMKHVHAMHHELIVPYTYGAQYIHPLDSFVGGIVGASLALAATGMSPLTTTFFYSVLCIKALDDHCGRWFPNYNPIHRFLKNNAAFHAVHHMPRGMKYNYSVHLLPTWDLLLGTYLPFTVVPRTEGGYEIRTAKDE
ncbi:sphinganine C4-monooxygenase 2-like [Wolffia australiana]